MDVKRKAVALALLPLAACEPQRPPPPSLAFLGLPVSGTLADAHRGGFTDCYGNDAISVRCRRHGETAMGFGPYEAAIDLRGSDGAGGFDQVTLWHDHDQYAVYAIADALEAQGWQHCSTGTDTRGDQIIYTRPGERVRVSMDLSYWGKRRLRLLPPWNRREARCTPEPLPSPAPQRRSSVAQQ